MPCEIQKCQSIFLLVYYYNKHEAIRHKTVYYWQKNDQQLNSSFLYKS